MIRPFSSIELACAVRQPGPCVRFFPRLLRCCPRTEPARDPGAVQCQVNTFFTLRAALFTPHSTLHTCTSSQLIPSKLFSSHFMSSHMSAKFFLTVFISSEHSSTFLISAKLVSTHFGSSARQKAWDIDAFTQKSLYKILCTTKLAQSTSQFYFVLQSLHRVYTPQQYKPSTTRLEENTWRTRVTPLVYKTTIAISRNNSYLQ